MTVKLIVGYSPVGTAIPDFFVRLAVEGWIEAALKGEEPLNVTVSTYAALVEVQIAVAEGKIPHNQVQFWFRSEDGKQKLSYLNQFGNPVDYHGMNEVDGDKYGFFDFNWNQPYRLLAAQSKLRKDRNG
jgi:hypothetical protein